MKYDHDFETHSTLFVSGSDDPDFEAHQTLLLFDGDSADRSPKRDLFTVTNFEDENERLRPHSRKYAIKHTQMTAPAGNPSFRSISWMLVPAGKPAFSKHIEDELQSTAK